MNPLATRARCLALAGTARRLALGSAARQMAVSKFSEASKEIAGPDGRRATQLLDGAKSHNVDLIHDLTAQAVRRLLASPDPRRAGVLFDDAELGQLQHALAGMIASADLLGRVRVLQRANLAGEPETFADRYDLAPEPDTYGFMPETIPVAQPPAAAVKYFQGLVPSFGTDPERYGPRLARHAFTLAHATDQTLLDKVKSAIADRIQGKQPIGTAAADVDDILDAAGVGPRNPQYADMVVRTNMMDAYNQGSESEMASPEMQKLFPVWRYDGILDDRTGDDHRPHIGKYYPAEAAFGDVRGPRVFNCRCSPTPLSKGQWRRAQANGATLEEEW